ncbi:MAG: O-antigen ligase family protein [Bacteroidales bacterium]|nr:O-antigen ligase family protein [Bacteroidales bacterium]
MIKYKPDILGNSIPSLCIIHGILILCLIGLSSFMASLQWMVIIGLLFSPLLFVFFFNCINNPRFCLATYATYSFFFSYVMRYLRKDGLSIGLDILVLTLFLACLLSLRKKNIDINLKNGLTIYLLTHLVWVGFVLIEFLNFGTTSEGMSRSLRSLCFTTTFLLILVSACLNTTKSIKTGLKLIGVFIIIAFCKLLYQKYIGFDDGELFWLYGLDGARTHIIYSGIRYFSLFSDAGNFGPYMAIITTVYGIIALKAPKKTWRLFCGVISLMGLIGMFMSGTRSAMIIPLSGLLLYCVLCKNIKMTILTAAVGICIYVFFSLTNIGEGNEYIRRMRTSFRPSEDASMNVRVENRKEIATYIKAHPFGAGIGGSIPKLWLVGDRYIEGTLPPDSYYVSVWIQTGTYGLILKIALICIVLLRCCWIIFFNIKNKALRNVLAAFACGLLGIYLNGYAGEAIGMPPTDFLITAMTCAILNGKNLDKQLQPQEAFI